MLYRHSGGSVPSRASRRCLLRRAAELVLYSYCRNERRSGMRMDQVWDRHLSGMVGIGGGAFFDSGSSHVLRNVPEAHREPPSQLFSCRSVSLPFGILQGGLCRTQTRDADCRRLCYRRLFWRSVGSATSRSPAAPHMRSFPRHLGGKARVQQVAPENDRSQNLGERPI